MGDLTLVLLLCVTPMLWGDLTPMLLAYSATDGSAPSFDFQARATLASMLFLLQLS